MGDGCEHWAQLYAVREIKVTRSKCHCSDNDGANKCLCNGREEKKNHIGTNPVSNNSHSHTGWVEYVMPPSHHYIGNLLRNRHQVHDIDGLVLYVWTVFLLLLYSRGAFRGKSHRIEMYHNMRWGICNAWSQSQPAQQETNSLSAQRVNRNWNSHRAPCQ